MFDMIRLVRSEFAFEEETLLALQKEHPGESSFKANVEIQFREGHKKGTQEPTGALIELTVSVLPGQIKKNESPESSSIVHGLMEYHFKLSTSKNKSRDEDAFDFIWILARTHIQKIFVEFGFPSPPIPLQRVKTSKHGRDNDIPTTKKALEKP